MQYTMLGRTGLRVSVAGLGCGGYSRLGLGRGKSEAEAVALIRTALDLGVTLLDTAAAYGTEAVVGQALAQVPRGSVVVATKAGIRNGDALASSGDVLASLEASLRALRTDHVDIFQLHAVAPGDYAHAGQVLAPALLHAREQGKLRHIGITETAPNDHHHAMLAAALDDAVWEVMMVAFNMMHTSARASVFPRSRAQGVGTLMMFAVRNVFSQPERLAAEFRHLVANGALPAAYADPADALGFLLRPDGASSLTDAAYRFVRHEPGADVVLFGTSDAGHLRANIASILKPALPDRDIRDLAARFGHLVGVGLDRPDTTSR